MARPVDLLSRICSVPGTDEPLAFEPDGTSRAEDGRRFRAVRGVPILRAEEEPVVERPTEPDSGRVPQERIDHMDSLPGYTLFVGAGNSTFRHPRVIEVEYHLFRDTDVVADAHRLPFRSDTFDLYFAMNLFEHLREPAVAAREALRILKPGGEVHVHTAFLQPLHEAPAHYYNATEFGAREWFRDFDGVECTVSGNFNPLYAVGWLSSEILENARWHLGPEAGRRIGELRLEEVAAFWRSPAGWDPEAAELFFRLPQSAQQGIAAGFEVRARKPASGARKP